MTLTNFHLSTRHRRVLKALIPIVCGPDAARLGLVGPILEHVEATLSSFAKGQRSAILAGLSAFELMAVVRPPFAPLSANHSAEVERAAALCAAIANGA